MNILELQLRVVISGVPESGSGPTPLDLSIPAFDRLLAVPPELSPPPDHTEPEPGWPDLTYRQL
jgi:hypothetical protein